MIVSWLSLGMHGTAALLAFLLTLFLIPAVIRLSERKGLLDYPDDKRRSHRLPVPRLGGVAIVAATCIAVVVHFAWVRQTGLPAVLPPYIFEILGGALIVFAVGVLDDLRGVPPIGKLLAQGAAALVVIRGGFLIEAIALTPSSEPLLLGAFALPVTLLWIVGVTNAFNLIDGVDGLAGTLALVALTSIIGVDLYLNGTRNLMISSAALGAVFGFLRFNGSPARIFLGDSGSMTLGFFLAIRIAVGATDAQGHLLAAIPIFALAYPLIDTGIAILRRWLRGERLSRADRRHIHHQLLVVGFTPRQTVELIGVIFLGVAVLGIAVVFVPPELRAFGLLVLAGIIVGLLYFGAGWLHYDEFTELGSAMRSVLRNGRTVIGERIRLAEHADRLAAAPDIEELERRLSDLTDGVHVLGIAVRVSGEPVLGSVGPVVSPLGLRPMRLEFPCAFEIGGKKHEMDLLIWGAQPRTGAHPAIEHVALVLCRVLELWFGRNPSAVEKASKPTDSVEVAKTPKAVRE